MLFFLVLATSFGRRAKAFAGADRRGAVECGLQHAAHGREGVAQRSISVTNGTVFMGRSTLAESSRGTSNATTTVMLAMKKSIMLRRSWVAFRKLITACGDS